MTSSNLEFVRSLFDAWGRGDFSSTDWADPEIEFVLADGPDSSATSTAGAACPSWGCSGYPARWKVRRPRAPTHAQPSPR
jgi:hypothetical protein